MEKKADVKAMMARFQAAGASVDETCSSPAGQIKLPLKTTLSTGPAAPTKKPALESKSGSAINVLPKPNFQLSTQSQEPNKAKALASRFGNIQDDSGAKPFLGNKPLKAPLPQAHEAKSPGWKPPLTASDSKPAFPKPSPAFNSKPGWVKEDSGGGLQKKPSSFVKLRLQSEETAEGVPNAANKPTSSTFRPSSNFRTAQSNSNKEPDSDGKADWANKPPPGVANAVPPPKPLPSKKPSLKKPRNLSPGSNVSDDASGPKRNPLPNSLALGPPPAKPNRPIRVNLESFKTGAVASEHVPGAFKKPITSTPLASNASNHSNHVTPPQPTLPPRHPGAMPQQDEDIDHPAPPPLPPSAGHPSRAKAQEDDGNSSDGDMYEALDERWEVVEQQQEKKKDKEDKEEKKRLEAEKKEQKEREKKELDAKKKFKLVGFLEVIHQGKALVDCRGGKNDLALKQGDNLDIIRVQGNPEGRWLGRSQDGSIGYVKTTSVEIDFNTLKNRSTQLASEPEIYDDIDVTVPDKSGMPGVDEEIYDDIDPNAEDSTLDSRSSPTKPRSFLRMFERSRRLVSTKVLPPPPAEGKSDPVEGAIDEIYDDVDSQNLPPLPPISSIPLRGKSKTEEMDPKKQKKFEKEEKDFRKKFKYDGEIQALYQVTISPTLTNKKWGPKELPVKAGEQLDVIVKAEDNKLICRNEDGKFGYVSTSHVDMNDGDIYDDIGEDCIYDND
uniref:FYN-binding protein 1 isoform X2 n=1 Tax=Gasterosteus aculeatus aculeatus TaxID=481459 RepID=UPI001A998C6E|nr:FYN-binding protein 1 isoform X2 [Gasterosteus aculeatus aculeatus]